MAIYGHTAGSAAAADSSAVCLSLGPIDHIFRADTEHGRHYMGWAFHCFCVLQHYYVWNYHVDRLNRLAVRPMNRRSFIKGLVRVGGLAAFDPHRVIFDFGRNLFLPVMNEGMIVTSIFSEPVSAAEAATLDPLFGSARGAGKTITGELLEEMIRLDLLQVRCMQVTEEIRLAEAKRRYPFPRLIL
jgi:hypothetical protein